MRQNQTKKVVDFSGRVLTQLFESLVPRACNKNGLKFCRIALQMIDVHKVHKNPGPNPSGIRDLRLCSNFEAQKRVQMQLKVESRKNKNGSHTESLPFKPFKIQIRERQHSCLSPFKSLVDLDRQLTQKLKYSDFNDSNLRCF